jgi:toxin-antitoxin system PIN domain toxin
MVLLDVNVLVYAHREDAPGHKPYHKWLSDLMAGDEPFGAPDLVLSGFLRVVTHPRVFNPPTPLGKALEFVEALKGRPNFTPLNPGARHFDIFLQLCRSSGARGNLVPDAYLAAIAVESGCRLATADRGFARFRGLRLVHPLERPAGPSTARTPER